MLWLALAVVGRAAIRPSLIPEPESVKLGTGTWTLDSSTVLTFDPSVEGAGDVAHHVAAILRFSTGFLIPVSNEASANARAIRLERATQPLGLEAHEVHVTADTVTVVASTASGQFYGLVTLLQLLPPEIYSKRRVTHVPWVAPVCSVVDSPRLAWRGVMLDVSRFFFDVRAVKSLLDAMAMLKLNTFHWHLTDDPGWRIEIKRYPNLTARGRTSRARPVPFDGSVLDNVTYGPFFYTQVEVKEIVRYARILGITVVPEIEMPGHSLGALAGYPEISCDGKGPFEPASLFFGHKEVLCAGNDRTLEIFRDVLDEVMELFDSEYIHTGGNECSKTLWAKCPKCQRRVKDEGLKNFDELQAWFTQQMTNYLESKSRHLVGWDEILRGGLAKGAAVMSWHGTGGGAAAAAMGHKVVMAPNSYYYLDYSQFPCGESDDIYQYSYHGNLRPLHYVYSYSPLAGIPEKSHRYIIGVECCAWAETIWGGELDMLYKTFPRAVALAETGWSSEASQNWTRFGPRTSGQWDGGSRRHRSRWPRWRAAIGPCGHPRSCRRRTKRGSGKSQVQCRIRVASSACSC